VLDAFADLGLDDAVAGGRALEDELAQVRLETRFVRRAKPRQMEALGRGHAIAVGKIEVDHLGDLERCIACLGQLGEDGAHLVRRLQVELLGVEPEPLAVGLELALLDAEQHVVRLRVLAKRVVKVVRRHHRHAEAVAQMGRDLA
jgi:hypothetical protein